jgi:hypothetical protein
MTDPKYQYGHSALWQTDLAAYAGQPPNVAAAGLKNDQRPPALREGKSQQAWAKQRQAGRSQGQKAVGDKVMIAHDVPSEVDARPNWLKLSERAFFMNAR